MRKLPTTGVGVLSRTIRRRSRYPPDGDDETQKRQEITSGDPDSRGPHADVRGRGFSGWTRVTVDGDLGAAVDEHGSETVFELDGATLGGPCNAGGSVAIVGGELTLRGEFGTALRFGAANAPVGAVVLADLTLDVSDASFKHGLIGVFASGDGAYLRDVDVAGVISGPGNGLSCTTEAGSVVECERLRMPDGATRHWDEASHDDSVGVIMSGASDGVLRLHDCEIAEWPNNGVYASGPAKHGGGGYAIITDHEGWGSDRDQLRVGGRSEIINPTLYVDESKPGFDNHRGVWFRYARGAVLRGGLIKTFPGSDPGSAIRLDSTAGGVEVENVDVELRGDHHAARGVEAHSPDDEARAAGASVEVRDSRFHGSGSPRDVILIQSGRSGSFVENTDIDCPNAEQEIDIR